MGYPIYDLDNFFYNLNGEILILLDERVVLRNEMNPESKQFIAAFVKNGWWSFCISDGPGLPKKFVRLSQDTVFVMNDQIVNIEDFHQIIRDAKTKWTKEFNLPFPNIGISKKYYHSISFDPKLESINLFLDPTIFSSPIDHFKLTLGHEIGHLLANKYIPQKPKFKWLGVPLLLLLFNTFILINLLFESNPVNMSIGAFMMSFLICGWVYYLGSWITHHERVRNYSKEFFADFFCSKFMNVNDFKLFNLGNSFRVYSHPSGDHRMHFTQKDTHLELEKWISPTEQAPFLFQYLSVYEFFNLPSFLIQILLRKDWIVEIIILICGSTKKTKKD